MQPKTPMPPITPVANSSAVTGTGYDAQRGILAVQFKGGKTYHYEGVPPAVVESMGKAESVGKFVSANVVGKFEQFKEKN